MRAKQILELHLWMPHAFEPAQSVTIDLCDVVTVIGPSSVIGPDGHPWGPPTRIVLRGHERPLDVAEPYSDVRGAFASFREELATLQARR